MIHTEETIENYSLLWKEPTYTTKKKVIDLTVAKRIVDTQHNPTHYYLSEGTIFRHNPKHIESWEDIIPLNLDPTSTEVLNDDFIKDNKRVFLRARLLKGVNPTHFSLINPLFAGNSKIIVTRYGKAKVEDPPSFSVCDDGQTPSPFSSEIDGYRCGYAVDKQGAYYFDESTSTQHALKIKSCKNPKALTSLKFSYAKDDKNVYMEGRKIQKANPDSFRIINRGYSTDGNHIFFHRYIVEGADLNSFEILPTVSYPQSPDPILNSVWAKDKTRYFCFGHEDGKSEYKKHLIDLIE